MTYREAFKKAKENEHLLKNVAEGSKSVPIPLFKQGVIIAPKGATLVELDEIYTELLSKKNTNEDILKKRGMIDQDLDVYIVAKDEVFISLSDFLSNSSE